MRYVVLSCLLLAQYITAAEEPADQAQLDDEQFAFGGQMAPSSREQLTARATAGNVVAMVDLASFLLENDRAELPEALRWLRKAVGANNADAMSFLAQVLTYDCLGGADALAIETEIRSLATRLDVLQPGSGDAPSRGRLIRDALDEALVMRQENAVMITELTALAEAGDAAAQCDLGNAYGNGMNYLAEDPVAARRWLEAAAPTYAPAAHILAEAHVAERWGLTRDAAAIFAWRSRAVETGLNKYPYPLWLASLAECHEVGQGTQVDPVKALALYRKAEAAARTGNQPENILVTAAIARLAAAVPLSEDQAIAAIRSGNLADLTRVAREAESKHPAAVRAWELHQRLCAELQAAIPQAEAGNVIALRLVIRSHQYGNGTRPDQEAAARWMRAGVAAGDADCMEMYALALRHGVGTPRDPDAADAMVRQACAAGAGRLALDRARQLREGTPPDLDQALAWFAIVGTDYDFSNYRLEADALDAALGGTLTQRLMAQAEGGDYHAMLSLSHLALHRRPLSRQGTEEWFEAEDRRDYAWYRRVADDAQAPAAMRAAAGHALRWSRAPEDRARRRERLEAAAATGHLLSRETLLADAAAEVEGKVLLERAHNGEPAALAIMARNARDAWGPTDHTWVIRAANAGDAESQYDLGAHYLSPFYSDVIKKHAWIDRAAAQGHPEASKLLAAWRTDPVEQENLQDAQDRLAGRATARERRELDEALAGNAAAQFTVGLRLFLRYEPQPLLFTELDSQSWADTCRAIDQDQAKGRAFLEQAAAQKHPFANLILAQSDVSANRFSEATARFKFIDEVPDLSPALRRETEKLRTRLNTELKRRWQEREAKAATDPSLRFAIAQDYLRGTGGAARDPQQALHWFRQVGSVNGHINAALLLLDGCLGSNDLDQAKALLLAQVHDLRAAAMIITLDSLAGQAALGTAPAVIAAQIPADLRAFEPEAYDQDRGPMDERALAEIHTAVRALADQAASRPVADRAGRAAAARGVYAVLERLERDAETRLGSLTLVPETRFVPQLSAAQRDFPRRLAEEREIAFAAIPTHREKIVYGVIYEAVTSLYVQQVYGEKAIRVELTAAEIEAARRCQQNAQGFVDMAESLQREIDDTIAQQRADHNQHRAEMVERYQRARDLATRLRDNVVALKAVCADVAR